MIGVIKTVRYIQVKNIAYHPHLFKAIIIKEKLSNETHPTEYDESDDIEAHKKIKKT